MKFFGLHNKTRLRVPSFYVLGTEINLQWIAYHYFTQSLMIRNTFCYHSQFSERHSLHNLTGQVASRHTFLNHLTVCSTWCLWLDVAVKRLSSPTNKWTAEQADRLWLEMAFAPWLNYQLANRKTERKAIGD